MNITPRSRSLATLVCAVGSLLCSIAPFARGDISAPPRKGGRLIFPYCQIVDRFPDPLHGASLALVPAYRVEGAGKLGWVETRGWTEWGYYRTARGDIALSSELRGWIPTSDGDLDLPDGLVHLWLRVRGDLRGYNGFTARAEIDPGFYADASALVEGFNAPVGLYGIQSLDDQLSGFLGLRIRPAERRLVEPAAGLRWAPIDEVLVDVGYPDTRVLFHLTPEWTAIFGAEWNRLYEFRLADDARERLRLTESRLYGAVRVALDRVWRFEVRGGVVAGREIDFKEGANSRKREMEGGPFISLGVGGSF